MINIVILWIEKLKHIEIYELIQADLCNNKWSNSQLCLFSKCRKSFHHVSFNLQDGHSHYLNYNHLALEEDYSVSLRDYWQLEIAGGGLSFFSVVQQMASNPYFKNNATHSHSYWGIIYQLNSKAAPKEREDMKMKGEHLERRKGGEGGNRGWKILRLTM